MNSQWPELKISEIAEDMGDAPFGSLLKTKDYTDQGALVLQGKNIQGRSCNWSDRRYVSHEKWEKLSRSHCFPGDLVFPKVGTIGKVGILTALEGQDRYLLSTNTMRLRVNEKIADRDYVYYFFSSPMVADLIVAMNSNSVQPVFNFTTLKNFRIPLPPLPEQQAIACVLRTLDDKIELNRRMNATLEALARAIFKSWFVDFDPVHAKASGEQPVGMDAATAALFPDRFEDSELGPIPEGWRVGTLDNASDYVLGGDWGKGELSDKETQEVLCIRGADIPDLQAGGLGSMPTRFISEASLGKRRLEHGDIVVEISGGSPTQSTGRTVFVTGFLLERLGYPLIYSNFCRLLRVKASLPSVYVYRWLRHLYDGDVFLQYETGTTGIKNFAYTVFSSQHPLLLPTDAILERFAEIVASFDNMSQQNGKQAEKLAETRDALLPKLMSGEIRIGNVNEH